MPSPVPTDHALIGAPDARSRIATPALVVDLDRFEANIAAMAEFARKAGIALRPHAKSHKCASIARRQIAAGALGQCCATLGEAEAFAAAGIGGLLVTSPQVTAEKVARLAALLGTGADVMVVVDDPGNVTALAAAMPKGRRLKVLVDLNVGQMRTGVATVDAALALARAVAAAPALEFCGLQAYWGHLQHRADFAAREAAVREGAAHVAAVRDRLAAAGLPARIVSGGGTGTALLDAATGVFTELQPGSYIFLDVDYAAVLAGDARSVPLAPSLFVACAVVSANVSGRATIDAGLKAMAHDGPKATVARGAPAGTTYAFAGDEHGYLMLPPGAAPPSLGTRVELLSQHCDPTVNLYDVLHCVRGETLVDIWTIDARGRH